MASYNIGATVTTIVVKFNRLAIHINVNMKLFKCLKTINKSSLNSYGLKSRCFNTFITKINNANEND